MANLISEIYVNTKYAHHVVVGEVTVAVIDGVGIVVTPVGGHTLSILYCITLGRPNVYGGVRLMALK